MCISSWANDLIEIASGSFASVGVDGLIIDEFRTYDTCDDFPEESDGFLVELLRIANITVGNLIERITLISKWFTMIAWFKFVFDVISHSRNDTPDSVPYILYSWTYLIPEKVGAFCAETRERSK